MFTFPASLSALYAGKVLMGLLLMFLRYGMKSRAVLAPPHSCPLLAMAVCAISSCFAASPRTSPERSSRLCRASTRCRTSTSARLRRSRSPSSTVSIGPVLLRNPGWRRTWRYSIPAHSVPRWCAQGDFWCGCNRQWSWKVYCTCILHNDAFFRRIVSAVSFAWGIRVCEVTSIAFCSLCLHLDLKMLLLGPTCDRDNWQG